MGSLLLSCQAIEASSKVRCADPGFRPCLFVVLSDSFCHIRLKLPNELKTPPLTLTSIIPLQLLFFVFVSTRVAKKFPCQQFSFICRTTPRWKNGYRIRNVMIQLFCTEPNLNWCRVKSHPFSSMQNKWLLSLFSLTSYPSRSHLSAFWTLTIGCKRSQNA